jgi:hypothetical protein
MFKGWGKFPLLLAGAALLVVSCGQGPSEVSFSGSASQTDTTRAEYTYTPEELGILDRNETDKIVRAARLDLTTQQVARNVKNIGWDSKAFAIPTGAEDTVVLLVASETDPASPALMVQLSKRSVLGYEVTDVGLLEVAKPSGDSVRMIVKVYETGNEVMYTGLMEGNIRTNTLTYLDWTEGDGELTGFHHPELPSDPPTCGMALDPCYLEKNDLKNANDAISGGWGQMVGETVVGGALAGAGAYAGAQALCGWAGPAVLHCAGAIAGLGAVGGLVHGVYELKQKYTNRDTAQYKLCVCLQAHQNDNNTCTPVPDTCDKYESNVATQEMYQIPATLAMNMGTLDTAYIGK